MEVLFRRYFWIFHMVFLALAAYLVAGVVMHLVAHTLAAEFNNSDDDSIKPTPTKTARYRNFQKSSEKNINDAKR